jgi:hypothetical protein
MLYDDRHVFISMLIPKDTKMLLDVTCKTGKLQVTEEGFIRVQAPFKRIVWQVPCSAIARITAKDGFMTTLDMTLYTEQGQYQADMITKQNASKLYALFPHLEVGATQQPQQQTQQAQGPSFKQAGIFHNKWYQDNKLRTYITTYENPKEMSKESAEAGQYGWIPQSTISTAGHFKRSFWIGLANSKDKITITYVRTPEWLAQNA